MAAAAEALLAEPSFQRAQVFAGPVLKMRPWPDHGKRWPQRLSEDGAWAWQTGHVSLEDW